MTSHWRHGVSNYGQLHCLFKHSFRYTSNKISLLCATGLLVLLTRFKGNPLVLDGFHSQRTSNAENVFMSWCGYGFPWCHYSDVIVSAMASQTTGVAIVCPTVCSGVDQRKHQSSVTLKGIHRSSVDSPQKGPVTPKMFPFDDVIMDRRATRNISI